MPKPPNPTIMQPLINVKVCDKNGQNCKILNACKFWKLNSKNEYYLDSTQALSKCNGILGVTSKDFTLIQKFIREMEIWIRNNIGSRINDQSQDQLTE
jgi:hypothetical protein